MRAILKKQHRKWYFSLEFIGLIAGKHRENESKFIREEKQRGRRSESDINKKTISRHRTKENGKSNKTRASIIQTHNISNHKKREIKNLLMLKNVIKFKSREFV